ncbi:MAG: TetR/AcrR family transcriptional regulator [Anaerolineae bacterium]|nr:TetR/AcrR family transcriptional regulator [Anaerolineae bacterium]
MPPRPDVSTERRTQIIEAALACFTRQGYVNTTMDDIAAESGLSKGAIYWYFKSKDDVFQAAFTSMFEAVGVESITALQACETAADRLRVGTQTMVGLARDLEGYFGLIIEFWAQSENRDEVMGFWAEILAQYQQAIAAVFEGGVQTGEFRKVDAGALAWMIMAAYDGLAAYDMMMSGLDLDKISETFIEALLKGLIADGESE